MAFDVLQCYRNLQWHRGAKLDVSRGRYKPRVGYKGHGINRTIVTEVSKLIISV